MHTHICHRGVCLSSRGLLSGEFCPGFLSGRFCPGGCPSPLLSEYIRYNRKLNITLDFIFHMYEIFVKCDVTSSWTSLPVTNCHTLSVPSPLERDVVEVAMVEAVLKSSMGRMCRRSRIGL